MRVGAPITLEPGPYSISYSALPRTGLRITPSPEATRKPLEAILAALGRDRLACGFRGLCYASPGTRFSSELDLLVGGMDRGTG